MGILAAWREGMRVMRRAKPKARPLMINTWTQGMEKLLPLFQRSGVRVMFSGHEHNFQHSRAPLLDHFVTGAAGKVRRARPNRFAAAHTSSWSTDCHFVLATIEGKKMIVRAIGAIDDPAAEPQDIERFDPEGQPVTGPVEITL